MRAVMCHKIQGRRGDLQAELDPSLPVDVLVQGCPAPWRPPFLSYPNKGVLPIESRPLCLLSLQIRRFVYWEAARLILQIRLFLELRTAWEAFVSFLADEKQQGICERCNQSSWKIYQTKTPSFMF